MTELTRFGIEADEVQGWIRRVAGDPSEPVLLNDKGWSVVVHFGVAVLKVTAPGAFLDGAKMFELVGAAAPGLVPEIVDHRFGPDGRSEMLFTPFGGTTVSSLPVAQQKEALLEMARTAAKVQAKVRSREKASLVTVRAADIPSIFDQVLQGGVKRCQLDFASRWESECEKQQIATDFARELRQWRSQVCEWAAELEEGSWSNSIDHVDLLPHNANLLEDGSCIIYDWEQAAVGVPFFSIDILLAHTQCIDQGLDGLNLRPEVNTDTQRKLLQAYREELPGPIELALLLSPVRYCWSEWGYAEAANVPHYGVDDVAWWLSRALRRWENAGSDQRLRNGSDY